MYIYIYIYISIYICIYTNNDIYVSLKDQSMHIRHMLNMHTNNKSAHMETRHVTSHHKSLHDNMKQAKDGTTRIFKYMMTIINKMRVIVKHY